MESGAGGLGPVASEPGKGSFPLPFLLPGRGAAAPTEQTWAGAERRGRGCRLLHRFSGDAWNPSDPPPSQSFRQIPLRPSAKLRVQHVIVVRTASLSTLHRTAWGSALAHIPPRSLHPAPSKSSALGHPWSNLGHPSLASLETTGCPLTQSPNLADSWVTALDPGWVFRTASGARPGSQPLARPEWLWFALRFPDASYGSPKLLTSLRSM